MSLSINAYKPLDFVASTNHEGMERPINHGGMERPINPTPQVSVPRGPNSSDILPSKFHAKKEIKDIITLSQNVTDTKSADPGTGNVPSGSSSALSDADNGVPDMNSLKFDFDLATQLQNDEKQLQDTAMQQMNDAMQQLGVDASNSQRRRIAAQLDRTTDVIERANRDASTVTDIDVAKESAQSKVSQVYQQVGRSMQQQEQQFFQRFDAFA